MTDLDPNNPFDRLAGGMDREEEGQPTVTPRPQEPAAIEGDPNNPFDVLASRRTKDLPPAQTSALGAAFHHALPAVAPGIGGFAAFGTGAEMGGLLGGVAAGPIGAAGGALIGGLAASTLGAGVVEKVQEWGLSKLPDSWKEALGQSERQREMEEKEHGTASFLGGIAPYALTMRPGKIPVKDLPQNATALQRIMTNPVTARLFGGAIMGGMEAGQELANGEYPDWTKVALSTGVGVILNKPTRLGERLTEIGARPVRAAAERLAGGPVAGVAPKQAPTLAELADAKVMGAGMDESAFRGTREADPEAQATATETRQAELLSEGERAPDFHAVARQIHPDLFADYDALTARRDELRAWLEEHKNPGEESIAAATAKRDQIQADLDAVAAEKRTAATDKRRRQLRADLGAASRELDALHSRREAFARGEGQETPEAAKVREHLMAVDYELRDKGRDVAAAYRRAAEAKMPERIIELTPEEEEAPPVRIPGVFPFMEEGGGQRERAPAMEQPTRPKGIGEGSKYLGVNSNGNQVWERPDGARRVVRNNGMIHAEAKNGGIIPTLETAHLIVRERDPEFEVVGGASSPALPPEAGLHAAPTPPQSPALPIAEQKARIAAEAERRALAAGEKPEQAKAYGQITAERFATRAALFKGARGSAVDLYNEQGAIIRSGNSPRAPLDDVRRIIAAAPEKTAAPAPKIEDKPTPGLRASTLAESTAIKNEWRKAAPFKDLEPFLEASKANQSALAAAAEEIAQATGAAFKNPGVKAKTARELEAETDQLKRAKIATARARLQRKAEDKGGVGTVTDQVRGGFDVAAPEQADQILAELAKRFEIIDEGWFTTSTGYFDRKAYVRFADGMIGELQFWPPGMFEAKEFKGGHLLYEGRRNLDEINPMAKVLDQAAQELYASVRDGLSESWKASLGKSGNLPNISTKAEGVSIRPSSPTSEELTRRQLPPENNQASPGAQKYGSPSYEPTLTSLAIDPSTFEVKPETAAPAVRAAVEAADVANSARKGEGSQPLPEYRAGSGKDIGPDLPAGVFIFRPTELNVDATRFQFKSGGDKYGVTGALRGVKKWDPAKAQAIIVWEQKDGKLFVADGHQRAGLARRLTEQGKADGIELPGILYREKDGTTADSMRAIAAVTNIANGSGSALDGAKVLRARPDLIDASLPLSAGKGKQAAALARLDDDAFRMVINGVIPENYGAIVGDIIPNDGARQIAAAKAIAHFEPRNETEAATLAQRVAMAELAKAEEGKQISMFFDDSAESTVGEEMRIVGNAIKQMKGDKSLFKSVVANAERIEATGSTIEREAARSITEDAEIFEKILSTDAYTAGPVRDALMAAAKELKSGQIRIGEATARVRSALRARFEEGGLNWTGDIARAGEPVEAGRTEAMAEAGGATEPAAGPKFDRTTEEWERLRQEALAAVPKSLPGVDDFSIVIQTGKNGAPHYIYAQSGGKKVGSLMLDISQRGIGKSTKAAPSGTVKAVNVPNEWRRKGISRELYKATEAALGEPLRPSVELLDPGRRFWEGYRPSALEGHVSRSNEEHYASLPAREYKSGDVATTEDAFILLNSKKFQAAKKAAGEDRPTLFHQGPEEREIEFTQGYIDAITSAKIPEDIGGKDLLYGGGRIRGLYYEGYHYGKTGRLERINDSQKFLRELSEPSPAKEYAQPEVEPGAEGLPQELIPGVRPVSDLDRIMLAADRPLRGGNAPAEGMFDEVARNQKELFQEAVADPSSEEARANRAAFWEKAGELDKQATGSFGEALDAWVGGPHDAIDRGMTGGLMIPKFLEEIPAAELHRNAAPIRELLRVHFGDYIDVYRGEAAHGVRSSGRKNVLSSYSTERKVAEDFAGADRPTKRKIITEEEIARAEEEYARTGETQIGGYRIVREPVEGYPDLTQNALYRGEEYITDTDGPRETARNENEWTQELIDRRQEALARVKHYKIPVDSVVWATNRFNQREIIALNPREYLQSAHGKVRLVPGKPAVITLFEKANPSTLLHETGHEWLEQMAEDAAHHAAPEQLRADWQTTLKWLGVDSYDAIKTKHHEKWARGVEQYFREGVAPSKELAGVFERFKTWLMKVYKTLTGLGAPINDDIRGVFDRLLAEHPQRTVVAPEREPQTALHHIHEADVETIPHDEAEPAADRIASETTMALEDIQRIDPEVADEIARAEVADTEARAAAKTGTEPTGENGAGAAGKGEVGANRPQSGPVAKGGGVREGNRPQPSSGSEATGEGDGLFGTPRGPDLPPLATRPKPIIEPPSAVLDKAGNIRLDNLPDELSAAPDQMARFKEILREWADKNGDFVERQNGPQTLGQMLEGASKILGEAPDAILSKKIGEAFNAREMLAVQHMAARAVNAINETRALAAKTGKPEDVMAFAQATQQLNLIQGLYSQSLAEAGRALFAARKIKEFWTSPDAQTALRVAKEATGKTLFQQEELARMSLALDSPEQIAKFVADQRKKNFGRMVLEYWINGLISSPFSQATYLVTNTTTALYANTIERALAAGVGAAARRLGRADAGVQIGEVSAALQGMAGGVAPGLKAGGQALKYGLAPTLPGEKVFATPYESEQAMAPRGKFDSDYTFGQIIPDLFGAFRGARDAIHTAGGLLAAGGRANAPALGLEYSLRGETPNIQVKGVTVLPLGDIVRGPSRMNAFFDAVATGVSYSGEIAAQAARIAGEERAAGKFSTPGEYNARIADLRQNPTPEMMENAAKGARELSLMGKGGALTQRLMHLTSYEVGGVPVLKFIAPFVRVAGNTFEQSLARRSVLGLFSQEIRNDLMGKNGAVAQDMAAARMIGGTVLAVAFGGLAMEGLLSGSGPTDPHEAAMWRLAGNQAHSARIGDFWYDLRPIGAMGTLANIAADIYDVGHKAATEDMDHAAGALLHAFTQNIVDQSFMKGPADLLKAVEDSDRYGASYVRTFLSSFVPYSTAAGQIAHKMDPHVRQARTIVDAMKAKTPGLSSELLPKRDIWGEEMPSREMTAGFLTLYAQKIVQDPVNQAMLNLGIHPAPVGRTIRNVELTDAEYDDFARISGRMAKMRLDQIVNSSQYQSWPTHVRHDVLSEIIRQTRETARGVVMMKYPHIPQDAHTAKISKLQQQD